MASSVVTGLSWNCSRSSTDSGVAGRVKRAGASIETRSVDRRAGLISERKSPRAAQLPRACIAPTAYAKLEQLELTDNGLAVPPLPADFEARIAELEAALNELRRDNRRVTELYDLVFERLRQDNPLKD